MNQPTSQTSKSESAQTFLVTTYQKVSLPVEDYDAEVTHEDLPSFSTDSRKHWMQTETHRKRILTLERWEMTYEQRGYLLFLSDNVDMYDVVSNWLTSCRSRMDAEKYISYLEQKYLTSKQAA